MGFTNGAIENAKSNRIDIVEVDEVASIDWADKAIPYEMFTFETVQCVIHKPQVLELPAAAGLQDIPMDLSGEQPIRFPNGRKDTLTGIIDRSHSAIRSAFQSSRPRISHQPPGDSEEEYRCDVLIRPLEGTCLEAPNGKSYPVLRITATALVQVATKVLRERVDVLYGDVPVREYSGSFRGHHTSVTLAESSNTTGFSLAMSNAALGPPGRLDIEGFRLFIRHGAIASPWREIVDLSRKVNPKKRQRRKKRHKPRRRTGGGATG